MTKPKQKVLFFEDYHEQFRPADIPDHWLIFNAPRPLFASYKPGSQTERAEWKGKFRRGIFYVAVDPEDPRADLWIEKNNQQDAALCIWLTLPFVVGFVVSYYLQQYPDRDIDWSQFRPADYFNQYLELEGDKPPVYSLVLRCWL